MQDIELILPGPQHTAELGRICYEAFRQISQAHGFEYDFPNGEVAAKVIGLIQSLPGNFQVAIRVNGQIAGSNFLIITDTVAGLGPITVDPAFHGKGLGRRLMQSALDYAAQNGVQQVRLLQDSYNTASLSLYASMGFEVREPIGFMQAAPATEIDAAVRRATEGDLPVIEELCVRYYKTSRRNEVAAWMHRGMVVLVYEWQGHIRGYLVPGKIGHGVAETEAVALAMISQITRYAPPGQDVFFCPLRNTSLYRGTLKAGCRLNKVMNLMSFGPYPEPSPVWMPSIAF